MSRPAARLHLSRDLDPARLGAAFSRFGRLHLPGLLPPAQARAVGEALCGDVPWHKSMHVGGKAYDFALDTLEAMPADRRADLDAAFVEGGKAGFQYRFDAWRLSDHVEAGRTFEGACAVLTEVHAWLNSEAFLGFIRKLTNDPRPAFADAQATRYRPGDFLTAHDDAIEGKKRLYAYVLNFTPAWRTDWGGLLAFHDIDGHLSEAYAPTFNALNIFSVPQVHSVTQVASYAANPRHSITGWIRER